MEKRGGSGGGGTPASFDRSTLRNVRVVQRNLVYVIGLPPAIALEETLKKPEYFGQYGRIVKVHDNLPNMHIILHHRLRMLIPTTSTHNHTAHRSPSTARSSRRPSSPSRASSRCLRPAPPM